MADESSQYAVIFDPENGFQLLNTATDEVADMAVLEGTWRKRGEATPAGNDVQGHLFTDSGQYSLQGQEIAGAQPLSAARLTTLRYGTLRIRSTGLSPYAIADPRISLRDDQAE
jgi:hypothetical protein